VESGLQSREESLVEDGWHTEKCQHRIDTQKLKADHSKGHGGEFQWIQWTLLAEEAVCQLSLECSELAMAVT